VIENRQFTLIAAHYDELMSGVPYRYWVDYVQRILDRMHYEPSTVLDVACGTGNVSEIFASRGFRVVGVDISPQMIEVARAKKSGVEYYVQDAAELDLRCCSDGPGRSDRGDDSRRRFDLAVCLFDSLNYITDPDRAAGAISRVGEHLVPGGVFIFDVNTIYALSNHFFDQAHLAPDSYPKYVWNSSYDRRTRLCRIDMLFEVLDEGGPRHFKEVHYQRGHSIEELKRWLVDANFRVVDVFHAYTFRKPTRTSDRVFFVARKGN